MNSFQKPKNVCRFFLWKLIESGNIINFMQVIVVRYSPTTENLEIEHQ